MKKGDEDGIDEFDEMGEMCEITLYIQKKDDVKKERKKKKGRVWVVF